MGRPRANVAGVQAVSRPAHLVCIQCGSCQDPTCPIPGAFPCRCPNGVRWQARSLLSHDLAVLAFAVGELASALRRAVHWPSVAVGVGTIALVAALVAR